MKGCSPRQLLHPARGIQHHIYNGGSVAIARISPIVLLAYVFDRRNQMTRLTVGKQWSDQFRDATSPRIRPRLAQTDTPATS